MPYLISACCRAPLNEDVQGGRIIAVCAGCGKLNPRKVDANRPPEKPKSAAPESPAPKREFSDEDVKVLKKALDVLEKQNDRVIAEYAGSKETTAPAIARMFSEENERIRSLTDAL